jgi:glutamyl-Q tRNA(Asp) synthetase
MKNVVVEEEIGADCLLTRGLAFRCRCSRRELLAAHGELRYPGTCRELSLPPADTAVRLRVENGEVSFQDGLRGPLARDIAASDGDFIIVRRDGLPAYHLAVVVDDASQGITDIVRGADLFESTPLHIYLQRQLGLPTPRYWHIPLLTNRAGEKLSKRAGATAVDASDPAAAAAQVLHLLGLNLPPELAGARPRELWAYAADCFNFESLAGSKATIVACD